jgi:tight adherence protein B
MTALAAALAIVAVFAAAAAIRPGVRTAGGSDRTPRLPIRRPRPAVPADAALADWLDELARLTASGSSLAAAIGSASAAAEVHHWLAPARHALDRCAPLDQAIGALPPMSAGCRLVAPLLATCAELGGPTAHALMRGADALRARVAVAAERAVMASQARASAQVLTLVPVGALAVLALTEASVRAAVGSAAGAACVVAGAVINAGGWWWMRRIVRVVS